MVRKKPAAENPLLRLEVSKKKYLCSRHGKMFHHFHLPVTSETVADVDGGRREKQKSDSIKDYGKMESALPVVSN